MDEIFYRIIRPFIKFIFCLLYRPKFKGIDKIPKEGRVILAGNHTNNLDCLFLISSTKRTIHFLAKDSLIKGIKKLIFLPMGIIPVNRKIHDGKALKTAIKVLNENKVIGIFPEGTINRSKDVILPFKIGAVKMGYEANSLIIPFVITGKYKLLRKGLEIEFFDPYHIKNDLTSENKLLEEKIIKELKRKKG